MLLHAFLKLLEKLLKLDTGAFPDISQAGFEISSSKPIRSQMQ